jgi:hypothetical protein
MEAHEASVVANDWMSGHGFATGRLRHVRYLWDFCSGHRISCDRVARRFFFIPSPFGFSSPVACALAHGWLVVFDPPSREAENPDECPAVWINECDGAVHGDIPASNSN